MISRIQHHVAMGLVALCACIAPPLSAQTTYPVKPLKLVVPYPPGASTDNLSRAFAQELSKVLGQSVVVENRPGASTTIATMAVKNAPADGYTLLFQSDGFYSAKIAIPNAAYAYRDFEVLAPLAQTPYALLTPAALKITTMAELAAYAQKAGDLTVAMLGVGPNQYTTMVDNLVRNLGIKVRMIPYKGGMEAFTAVMTGQVDAYFATVSLARSQKDNPRVSVVALTAPDDPNPFFPEVKSFKALGLQNMTMVTFFGIAVRAGTPIDVKSKLLESIAIVNNSEAMRRARQAIALEEFTGSTEDYVRASTALQKVYVKD